MRAKRTDGNHRAVTAAIRALGLPVKSLHTQGGGVEDLLVGLVVNEGVRLRAQWLLIEIKVVERESTGYYRHTKAQKEWYAATEGFPRLVVISPQDAVDKLRGLQNG